MSEKDPKDTESPEFIERLTDEGLEPVEEDPEMESPFDESDYVDDEDDDEIVFPARDA